MSTIPTRIVPVSPFKPLATYAGIRAVYTTADGERLVGVTEVGEGTVTGGHLIVRFEDGKYGMTGDVTLEVVLEPSSCVNAQHDHTTGVDLDGSSLDAPIPMLCTDCGVPTHYDETIRDYVHDDPTSGACPLAYAADETAPAVSPCVLPPSGGKGSALRSLLVGIDPPAVWIIDGKDAGIADVIAADAAAAEETRRQVEDFSGKANAAMVAEHGPEVAAEIAAATDRNATIAAIRAALRKRSGKTWSVKGGRGTSYSWITISAPPARCDAFGSMTDEDARELADLLGLDAAHHQGVMVASSSAYRREYIARAEGRTPSVVGKPYWD